MSDWDARITAGVEARIHAAAAAGLLAAAEHVLGEASKIVPIEEATLSRSGKTSLDAPNLTASVSYDTPYAVKQHEDLTLTHDPGRSAKYLERPLMAAGPTVGKMIAAQIRRVTQ